MSRLLLWLLVILTVSGPTVCAAASPAAAMSAQPDWQHLYGKQPLRFTVMRKGQAIGSYTTRFVDDAGGFRVEAQMAIEVKVLLWDYRYQYQAEEVWQRSRSGDVLDQLQVAVNDDGQPFRLSLQRQGQQLVGHSSDGELAVTLPMLTTQHYNAAVLRQSQVLNTLTGKVNRIKVVALGQQVISAQGQQRQAQHYRYEGELHDTEVWYDDEGRWLRLRFRGKDGTAIEFICQQCGLPEAQQAHGRPTPAEHAG
ncbi:hypothetical protein C4K68_08085 [Pokkaliibacter plantistimulans]|uniref:DUF3108 domain-containing protein n=1 Tax=Proteobacteria bacterium 228 TaxID=2083153 RepID=A0A2S5KSY2_9PROT|nr:DUF6134 family protein [Pokkaliibacter plantistimulans]PPC77858.1 hypothetical protein C4K68_08085 [Pokkaliibacter plantistimulans]